MEKFNKDYIDYIESCLSLVSTMIIKSRKDAIDMNQKFIKDPKYIKYNLDLNNEKEWIYYKHISGEYHITDEPMYVVSMDTTERIIFNKHNLLTHKNTKKEYSYGTKMYEELVYNNPNNELLIKGILNPCSIDKAMDAKDGTILSYDTRFIEPNEYSLIQRLQEYIYGLYSRWYQKQYNLDNCYYNNTFMGILYQKVFEEVIQIRLDNCLTNEAHSYHYKNYLASEGNLDEYIPFLSLKQRIVLYKNIKWIRKHVGKKKTQEWLIKNILTSRNIPVSEYNMYHDYRKITEEVKPRIYFEKIPLNGLEVVNPLTDYPNLKELMDKEDDIALHNENVREFEEKEAKNKLSLSVNSKLKTKVLESKVISMDGEDSYKKDDIILDTLIDTIHRDLYKPYIFVSHPVTNEVMSLSGKDALILLTYTVYQILGIKDNCIPDYVVGLSVVKEKPNIDKLRSIIPDNTIISNKWIDFVIENHIFIGNIYNVYDFYDKAMEIFNTINKLLDTSYMEEDLDAVSYKLATIYQLFNTKVVSFRTEEINGFDAFLNKIDFIPDGIKTKQWYILYMDIWNKLTGRDEKYYDSSWVLYDKLISLINKLSSYSVHYLKEFIDDNVINLNTNIRKLRLTNDRDKSIGKIENELTDKQAISVIDHDTKSFTESFDGEQFGNAIRIQSILMGESMDEETSINRVIINVDIDLNLKLPFNDDEYNGLSINTDMDIDIGLSCWYEGDEITGINNPLSLPNLPGMQSWINLPNKQKVIISDQYNTDLKWIEHPTDDEISRDNIFDLLIYNTDVDGFDYDSD